jgi:hypothetical protein
MARKKYISRRYSQIEKTQMNAEFPFLTSHFFSIINWRRQRGILFFLKKGDKFPDLGGRKPKIPLFYLHHYSASE